MKVYKDILLILLFQLIYQHQNVRSSSEESVPEVEESQELTEPAASSEEQKHSHKHRHNHRTPRRHKNRSHNHDQHELDHDHKHDHDQLRAKNEDYNDDCDCSCNKCENPSDCCRTACQSCQSNLYQQSSVVFVPYPYPLVMPSPIIKPVLSQPNAEVMRAHDIRDEPSTTITSSSTTTITTTTTTTTPAPITTTITTTESPTDFINTQNNNKLLESVLKSVVDDYANIIAKSDKLGNPDDKYLLNSFRRTQPTWMPKYGIVPIADKIAEKLLSKISRSRVPLRNQRRVPMHDKRYLRTLSKKY